MKKRIEPYFSGYLIIDFLIRYILQKIRISPFVLTIIAILKHGRRVLWISSSVY